MNTIECRQKHRGRYIETMSPVMRRGKGVCEGMSKRLCPDDLGGFPNMTATKLYATNLTTACKLTQLNKSILLFYRFFIEMRFKIKYYERNRG